jgi:SH3-like domain-containing protein
MGMMRLLFRIAGPILVLTLLLAPALGLAQEIKLVKAKTLTLRESPATNAKAVETLITCQPVRLLDVKDKKWAKIRTIKTVDSQQKTGWVLASYLSDTGFVMVDHEKLNVRRGPGTEYAVIMNYGKNFPVRVLDVARNGWIKVLDIDGDRGWIHPNLIRFDKHYVITRLPSCNIRKGPGTDNPIVFTAERGVFLLVIEEKEGWLHVRHEDGDEGWISSKIVFGWRDVEDSKKD